MEQDSFIKFICLILMFYIIKTNDCINNVNYKRINGL